jgi:hypothetical protein
MKRVPVKTVRPVAAAAVAIAVVEGAAAVVAVEATAVVGVVVEAVAAAMVAVAVAVGVEAVATAVVVADTTGNPGCSSTRFSFSSAVRLIRAALYFAPGFRS